jgi:hypothetical protein
VLAGAGLLAAGAVLAVVLFWPSKGTLLVESDDPEAELAIKRDEEVVYPRTKDRAIALAPGSYTVELVEPKPGLKLSTDKFEITSKSQTRVRLVADRPKPPVGKPPTVIDPDRKAAEYVLSLGGSVRVNSDDRDTTAVAALPKGPLALTRVNLHGKKAVTDAGLAALKNCTALGFLDLHGTQIGDAGVEHVKDCPLSVLVLHGTEVTDAGLARLKDRTTLTYLYLSKTRVTDAGLAFLKDHKSLMMLDLGETAVTDTGLKALVECSGLIEVKFEKSKVTRAGCLELAGALPRCRRIVCGDGRVIEQEK